MRGRFRWAQTFQLSSDSRKRPLTLVASLHSRCFASAFFTSRTASEGRLRSPRARGEVKQANSFPRRPFAPESCQTPSHRREKRKAEGKTRGVVPLFLATLARFRSINPNAGTFARLINKEAERRQTLVLPAAPSGAAPPSGAARLSASHHGSHQRDSSSLRLSFRPGFLGRGLTQDRTNDPALATLPAGVTRHRLSQSREAPPAPVIMPGD
jgi:hypothetical protein